MAEGVSKDKPYNVDDALCEKVIENKIEKLNVLSLTEPDHCIIFMVLFALGVHKGVRTPLGKVRGWVRPAAFSDENLALLDAVVLDELRKIGQENRIIDRDVRYKIVEEYVNTGVHIIDEMIPSAADYNEDLLSYELLDMISDEYDKVFP